MMLLLLSILIQLIKKFLKKIGFQNRKRRMKQIEMAGKRKVQESSTDEQLVIIRNGEKEVPIVVETKKPDIRGVLSCCERCRKYPGEKMDC